MFNIGGRFWKDNNQKLKGAFLIARIGPGLSKKQEVYLQVLQQLLQGAGCKVKEQHLIQLLWTIKEYYPAFPNKGTLDIEVWEEAIS